MTSTFRDGSVSRCVTGARCAALVVLTGIGAASASGGSIPIANGDFESPAVPLFTSANAASFGSGLLHNVDSPTAFTSWPAPGHQTGYSEGGPTTPPLVQTLTATLESDTTYTLSVDVGRRLDQPFQFWQIRLNVVDGSSTWALGLVDSSTLAAPPHLEDGPESR